MGVLDRASRDRPIEEWERPIRRFSKRILSSLNASVYKLTDGQVAGTIPGGAPLLLLERTSCSTGKTRQVTLLYVEDPDTNSYVVAGSSGGAPVDPDWIKDIEGRRVKIQVQADRIDVTASVLDDGGDYDRYWALLTARYHFFNDYKKRVERQFTEAEEAGREGKVRRVIPIAVLTV